MVAEREPSRFVIECKRVHDAPWVFLAPERSDATVGRTSALWTNYDRTVSPFPDKLRTLLSGWADLECGAPSFESAFCAIPGVGPKDRPIIETIGAELIAACGGIADQIAALLDDDNRREFSVTIPMIVTTAELYVCVGRWGDLALATGKLDHSQGDFHRVTHVRLRKALSLGEDLSSTVGSSLRQSLLPTKNRRAERTILVVNAEHLGELLESWVISSFHQNAPWEVAMRQVLGQK